MKTQEGSFLKTLQMNQFHLLEMCYFPQDY